MKKPIAIPIFPKAFFVTRAFLWFVHATGRCQQQAGIYLRCKNLKELMHVHVRFYSPYGEDVLVIKELDNINQAQASKFCLAVIEEYASDAEKKSIGISKLIEIHNMVLNHEDVEYMYSAHLRQACNTRRGFLRNMAEKHKPKELVRIVCQSLATNGPYNILTKILFPNS